MPAPIQLSLNAVTAGAAPRRLAALRKRFRGRHVVRLPGFLSAELLARLQKHLARATYRESRNAYGLRETASEAGLVALLPMLLSDSRLFRFIEEVTGCPPIGRVTGNVFRSWPGKHFLDWHSDLDLGDRVAAMTVNLSPRPFRGGTLQVKRRKDRGALAQERYRGAGEAMLMRIDPYVLHRSTRVRGKNPKLIFACFFYARSTDKSRLALVKRLRRSLTSRPAAAAVTSNSELTASATSSGVAPAAKRSQMKPPVSLSE